jgi:signal transduction histidine kinase
LLKHISNIERRFKLPMFVKSDPERLKLVLINIISNSINYSLGEISVKMSYDYANC